MFRANVNFSEQGCWNYKCSPSLQYGYMEIARQGITAHRLSFTLFNKRDPFKLVCHHCDNPKCVNPDHFFEGDQTMNMQDSSKKGRIARGETHGIAKLTVSQVKEIYSMKGQISSHKLALIYGVSPSSIQNIWNGVNWKDLNLTERDPDYFRIAEQRILAADPAFT